MLNINGVLKNRLIYIVLIVSVVLNFVFFKIWTGWDNDGRLYSSKQLLCIDFAQSYLKTVRKTDNITDFGGGKWIAAVAIESDFYEMCLLDLNKEALKNYKTTNIQKFLKE